MKLALGHAGRTLRVAINAMRAQRVWQMHDWAAFGAGGDTCPLQAPGGILCVCCFVDSSAVLCSHQVSKKGQFSLICLEGVHGVSCPPNALQSSLYTHPFTLTSQLPCHPTQPPCPVISLLYPPKSDPPSFFFFFTQKFRVLKMFSCSLARKPLRCLYEWVKKKSPQLFF